MKSKSKCQKQQRNYKASTNEVLESKNIISVKQSTIQDPRFLQNRKNLEFFRKIVTRNLLMIKYSYLFFFTQNFIRFLYSQSVFYRQVNGTQM